MFGIESAWARWALAAALTVAAAAVNQALQPLFEGRAPLMLYFSAVLATSFFAGVRPALASLVLSTALLSMAMGLWTPAWHAPRLPDAMLLVVFVVAAAFGIAVTQAARNLVAAHRGTRARLHMALAAGQMTTWEWEVASGRMWLAPGAEAVLGTRCSTSEEAWRLVHDDDRERVAAVVRAALDGPDVRYSFVHRLMRPDGELRWVETHGHVIRDAALRAVRVTGVTVDVTARQRALEASRSAQARFEIATRSSNIIMWECDRELRYTWVRNPQLGFKADDLVGRRMGDLVPRDQASDYFDAADRVLATGKAETVPVRTTVSGSTRHFLSTIDARTDERGQVVGLTGASIEVTPLKLAEEALKQEVERKDNFVTTLAHELRNPMAPIRYAAAMLSREVPDAVRREAQQVIERQSAHMAHLLDDLLDLSRITRNLVTLQRERMDLRAAIEQAAAAAKADVARKQQHLAVTVPEATVWVQGDVTRLLQILGNLLNNAIKYTPPGGHLGVTLSVEGHEAVLTVNDDGAGLAPESLAQVFELFARGRHERRQDPGGLGIGLAVVKRLVELHGGQVQVSSRGPGQGAAFTVRLPLALEAAAPQQPEGRDRDVLRLGRGLSVLVVDDNADAADMLAAVLRLDGYAVAVAYNGTQALDALDTLRPAVVLLDLGLPDLHGHEVARRMALRQPAPKLVAISGWGQQDDRRRSAEAGFHAHLLKPVAAEDVRKTIESLVGEGTGAACGT